MGQSTVISDIRAAFEVALSSIPLNIEIAWENVEYDMKNLPIDKEYLRPSLLYSRGEVLTIDAGRPIRMYQGFYQIDIYIPLGRGMDRLNNISNAITNLFADTSRLEFNSTVVFIRPITPGLVRSDNARLSTFMEIGFVCYDN